MGQSPSGFGGSFDLPVQNRKEEWLVVGGVIGGAVGAKAAPDPTVVTYVKTNPVDPIYLDGEVVVGSGIPDTVMLAPVPESTYEYAYLNGVPVLVDTKDRKAVYILR